MKIFTLVITTEGKKIPLAHGPLEPKTDLGMLMASVAGVLKNKNMLNIELSTQVAGGENGEV